MSLRIEKDVPITGKRELPEFVAEVRETLAQMEVGDSFIVEGEKKVTTTRYQISNIYNWDKDGPRSHFCGGSGRHARGHVHLSDAPKPGHFHDTRRAA